VGLRRRRPSRRRSRDRLATARRVRSGDPCPGRLGGARGIHQAPWLPARPHPRPATLRRDGSTHPPASQALRSPPPTNPRRATVPRLRQVSRDDAPDGIVATMYDFIFGDRDPVAEPGLPNGTRGDWWTVVAQSPDLLAHCVSGFEFYQSARRGLPADLRDLAQYSLG